MTLTTQKGWSQKCGENEPLLYIVLNRRIEKERYGRIFFKSKQMLKYFALDQFSVEFVHDYEHEGSCYAFFRKATDMTVQLVCVVCLYFRSGNDFYQKNDLIFYAHYGRLLGHHIR